MVVHLPLVGREAEQRTLLQALQGLERRQGRLILIGAEAGGGKSALIGALTSQSAVPVCVGYCPGPGETAPYGPWLEALHRAAACRERSLEYLPPPFGQAGGEWTDRDCAAALAAWVRTDGRPCVLALEDIHWADPRSLDLLHHLPNFLSDVPLLVVATYRHDEVHRKHPLWALLPDLQRSGALRMGLQRLSVTEVAQLVGTVLPMNPDGTGMAARLHGRTDGHPFLVHELLVAAQRTGSIPTEDEELPETALQMIDLRLANLPDESIALLQAGALIGERFSLELLAQVYPMEEEAMTAALELAERLRILRPASPEAIWFDHALFRQALLRRLSVFQRRRLHQRIAEALLAKPVVDPELLALHLSRANDPRAVVHLLRAGDRSIQIGALVQAGDRYKRALELVDVVHPLRAELLLKLGFTTRLVETELARTCWEEAAQQTQDDAVAAWANHFLALYHVEHGDPDPFARMEGVRAAHISLLSSERYRQLEADLFGQVSGYPRIVPEMAQLHALRGRLQDARRLLEQARPLAAQGSLQPKLLWAEIYVTMAEGRTADCCPLWGELSDQYLQLRDYRQAAAAAFNQMAYLFTSMADQPELLDRAAERTLRLERLALERSGIGLVPAGYDSLGLYHYIRGHWDEARRQLHDYFRAHPEDRRFVRRVPAFELQMAQGDLAGAREMLAGVVPLRPEEPPGHNFQLFTHGNHALLALATGEPESARAWLEAADRWDAARGSVFTASIALAWAAYYRHVGDPEAALAAGRRAISGAVDGNQLQKLIQAHRVVGELLVERGELDGAADQFTAAESLAERCRFPYELALSQLSRARGLPSSPGAEEALVAAHETLKRLGAAPALAVAAGLLRQRGPSGTSTGERTPSGTSTGERAPSATQPLPCGLSRREAEVALCVAQGQTDKAVAAALFISRRTVDTHLRHIFGKVGVPNRAALGTWVAEQGLQRYVKE